MIAMAPSFVRAYIREMQGYTPGEQPGLASASSSSTPTRILFRPASG